MHTLLRALLVTAAALVIAGCGPTQTGSPTPATAPSPAASINAGSPAPSGGTGSQTDTEWGRIWDSVPAGFPRFPGSTIADDASPEPASVRYAIAGGGDPADIASWMQSALETSTFSTQALSGPLEDGSFVLDSVGEGDCKIRVTVAPMGGLIFVTVLYGAACPNA